MADELVFYTNPQSRGQVVRWMLEELGRPYRTEVLTFGEQMKSPAYLAINPMGKVPAITHRGQVVTEGAAICAYLADAYPDAGLAPVPGDPMRAPYLRWLFFAAAPFEQAFTSRAMGWQVPADRERMVGFGSYEHTLAALEQMLEGRAHVTDRFSAADVYLGSGLSFAMQTGAIETRSAFVAYTDALKSRPAAIRARSIDERLVKRHDENASTH